MAGFHDNNSFDKLKSEFQAHTQGKVVWEENINAYILYYHARVVEKYLDDQQTNLENLTAKLESVRAQLATLTTEVEGIKDKWPGV